MYKIKEKPEDFIVDEIIDLKTAKDGRYSYFLLKKTDHNTEDALKEIARTLKIRRKDISHCGNKDKIAVTKQYISVDRLDYKKRKDTEIENISIKYLGQGPEPLSLGSHKGNRFIIIVTSDKEPSTKTSIKNLFGPQRFSRNNHLIGKDIVLGNWKKAIELILENSGEHEDNIREALHKSPNDYIGALRKVPKKILTLYVHAYQSELFNRMAEDTDKEALPLIGFGTEETDEVKNILDEEKISTRDFIIRQIPELSSEGEKRNVYMNIDDLDIEKLDKDRYKVSFSLGKGSYATVVIDSIFS